MFRRTISPLNESYRANVMVGCVVGAIVGVASNLLAVGYASPGGTGYAAVMLDNVIGLGLLFVIGSITGIVLGAVIGAIEAGASFAVAFIAADRNWSVKFVFAVLSMICVLVNVTIAATCSAMFLGIDGSRTSDYAGLSVITCVTLAIGSLFGYAQSLDWPTTIDIRDTSVRVDRTDNTLRYDDLTEKLGDRLSDGHP